MPLIRHEPLGVLACARSPHRNDALQALLRETVQHGVGEWNRLSNLGFEASRELIAHYLSPPSLLKEQERAWRHRQIAALAENWA